MAEWAPAGHDTQARTVCPNCGANIGGGQAICRFCGSLLRDSLADDEFRRACRVFIKSLNKTLENASPKGVVLATVIGVLMVPGAIHIYLNSVSWGPWGRWLVTLFAAFLGLAAVGILLSAEQKRLFNSELKPRIERFMHDNGLTSTEFLSMARTVVKDSDPLLEYLDDIVA